MIVAALLLAVGKSLQQLTVIDVGYFLSCRAGGWVVPPVELPLKPVRLLRIPAVCSLRDSWLMADG